MRSIKQLTSQGTLATKWATLFVCFFTKEIDMSLRAFKNLRHSWIISPTSRKFSATLLTAWTMVNASLSMSTLCMPLQEIWPITTEFFFMPNLWRKWKSVVNTYDENEIRHKIIILLIKFSSKQLKFNWKIIAVNLRRIVRRKFILAANLRRNFRRKFRYFS